MISHCSSLAVAALTVGNVWKLLEQLHDDPAFVQQATQLVEQQARKQKDNWVLRLLQVCFRPLTRRECSKHIGVCRSRAATT